MLDTIPGPAYINSDVHFDSPLVNDRSLESGSATGRESPASPDALPDQAPLGLFAEEVAQAGVCELMLCPASRHPDFNELEGDEWPDAPGDAASTPEDVPRSRSPLLSLKEGCVLTPRY